MKKITQFVRLASPLMLSLLILSAAHAQSTDPALVSVVTGAFDKTLASTSLHIEAQSTSQSGLGGDAGGIEFGSTSTYDLAKTDTGWNISGTSTTQAATPNGSFDTSIDLIVLDGAIYMKTSGGAGFAPPNGGDGTNTATIPQGWFELTGGAPPDGTAPADPNAAPQGGFGARGGAGQETRAVGALLLPVTAESISAISELPTDTIDGQAMRVFQVSLDSQTVIDSAASTLLTGGGFGGGGFGGPGFGRGQGQGAPTDAQAQQGGPAGQLGNFQPPSLNPENVQITLAVYIGQDDGYVHRIYSVIATASASPDGAQVATTVTSIAGYSAFDVPVTITAPQIGS